MRSQARQDTRGGVAFPSSPKARPPRAQTAPRIDADMCLHAKVGGARYMCLKQTSEVQDRGLIGNSVAANADARCQQVEIDCSRGQVGLDLYVGENASNSGQAIHPGQREQSLALE
jgi:hypothetical protein